MRKLCIVALAFALCWVTFESPAFAKTRRLKCRKIISLSKLPNLLYKNSNVHGGRGRTLIDSSGRLGRVGTLWVAKVQPGTLQADGTKSKPTYPVFSCFGLWACDEPYGCRYYQAMCGDGLSNSSFAAKAKTKAGKLAIVGNGRSKTCYSFPADASRFGNI